jgi:hypothetical protein
MITKILIKREARGSVIQGNGNRKGRGGETD